MLNRKKREIQKAINAAWANPAGAALREKLFPDGKPTPEQFVQRVSDYARQRLSDNESTV